MDETSFSGPAVSPFRRLGAVSRRPPKSWPRLTGQSEASRRLEDVIGRVATFDCSVLITGETGCGKEEVARAIHAASPRRDGPFVSINCGGLVATLAESHFFGHEKGAFTGAVGSSLGGFRAANGGVVFLDEIGEMPLELQPKLLQVLQRWEITPVGSTRAYPIDVQVIAATNRDLEAQIGQGLFREDLLYRINTVHISIPPLRSRVADIPAFIEHFSAHFARKYDRPPWRPDADLLERFLGHSWPGNVRQLAQVIQRLYVFEDRREWVLEQLFQEQPVPEQPVPEQWVPEQGVPEQGVPEKPVSEHVPEKGAERQSAQARFLRIHDQAPGLAPGLAPDVDQAPGMVDAQAAEVAAPPRQIAAAAGVELPTCNLVELRRLAVRQALAATQGHRGRAADMLGVSLNTMTKLVAEVCPELASPRGRKPKPR